MTDREVEETMHELGPTGNPVTIQELIGAIERKAPEAKEKISNLINRFKEKGLKDKDLITHVEFDVYDNISKGEIADAMQDAFRAKVRDVQTMKRLLAE